jgi:hypothetical protein
VQLSANSSPRREAASPPPVRCTILKKCSYMRILAVTSAVPQAADVFGSVVYLKSQRSLHLNTDSVTGLGFQLKRQSEAAFLILQRQSKGEGGVAVERYRVQSQVLPTDPW